MNFPKLRAVFYILCYFSLRKLFPHEYRKTKAKGNVRKSFRFDDFPPQNGRSFVADEESIDYLLCVRDNSDCMYIRYVYRHVRRCVHTLGRVRTRHDNNACVDSIHECYLDISLLQVSYETGCNFRSIKNVIQNRTKYITEVVTGTENGELKMSTSYF